MSKQQPLGTLYVISAPSGGGKTSLVNAIIEADKQIEVSVSYTTRPARPKETNRAYHFVDEKTFKTMMDEGKFVEHAKVFEHYYGTPRRWLNEKLENGVDVILEIDWQGARQIASKLSCVSIFIIPPSRQALSERLKTRAQDDEQTIALRMSQASNEIAHYQEFDYVVVNDVFEEALADIKAIIRARRRRLVVQRVACADILEELTT